MKLHPSSRRGFYGSSHTCATIVGIKEKITRDFKTKHFLTYLLHLILNTFSTLTKSTSLKFVQTMQSAEKKYTVPTMVLNLSKKLCLKLVANYTVKPTTAEKYISPVFFKPKLKTGGNFYKGAKMLE